MISRRGYRGYRSHMLDADETARIVPSYSFTPEGVVRNWPDPTPEMLQSPQFEAVWQAIKGWDIHVPGAYGGYCGATGNHVRAILDAISGAK